MAFALRLIIIASSWPLLDGGDIVLCARGSFGDENVFVFPEEGIIAIQDGEKIG